MEFITTGFIMGLINIKTVIYYHGINKYKDSDL
jgi:hypothetical protein